MCTQVTKKCCSRGASFPLILVLFILIAIIASVWAH